MSIGDLWRWLVDPANWQGSDGIPTRLGEQVHVSVESVVIGAAIALREVDPDIKEAARGMGYRELAQVLRVELPLAVPLIMAGVRTSAVQVVATATLAAVVAGGGFGRYIVDGLATQDYVTTAAGAVLVALLALAT